MSGGGYRVKGWHVLAVILGFFGVTIAVNATFIAYAVGTFSGTVNDDPYVRGLDYGDTLAARAEQAARGWTASLDHVRVPDGAVRLIAEVRDADGAPVTGLLLTGVVGRPATAAFDREVAFAEGGGLYVVFLEDLDYGDWDVTLATAFPDGAPFEARKRIRVR